jgi:putative PIN family toxin of toxin-antitoxin system
VSVIDRITHPALLAELERVLAYPKLARVFPEADRLISRLRAVVDLVEPTVRLAVVADEPDNRVLEAAVAGRADAVGEGWGRSVPRGVAAGRIAPRSFTCMPAAPMYQRG